MPITSQKWGVLSDGTPVELFTLKNEQNMEVSISTYGGIITRLLTPDRNGVLDDVVLGYDSLDDYLNDCCCFGCIIGRVANRLSDASFLLDNVEYKLDKNHGKHQLHGGAKGFCSRVWQADISETSKVPSLTLTYLSVDGEMGYPGNLEITITYTLTDDGLQMDCMATTDKPTVVNITNHSYFNLSGQLDANCLDHILTIPASRYLPTDANQIPTGELAPVAGTPLDFTNPATIGSRINDNCEPFFTGQGYDHFFILDDDSTSLRPACVVHEPNTGRVLEVHTTQPGVVFYSGNHMPKAVSGKSGAVYGFRSGLCLETQGFIDAPNRKQFPPIVLRPEEVYEHTTIYQFSVK